MGTPTRLQPILASVRQRSQERRALRSLADLRADAQPDPVRRQRFVEALAAPGLSFIAECKRRSPSVGALSSEVNLLERAQSYSKGGASALSILTEQDHFRGSLEDLVAVKDVGLPRLRKDFVLDEGMLYESVEHGADAILLLVVCLSDEELRALRQLAGELGLAVLCEIHDERELDRAIAIEPDCLGVNARDLRSFEVNLEQVERLLPCVPENFVRVAESGLREIEDLKRVQAAGADAALVGEALMRSPNPTATLQAWKQALES